MSFSLFCICKRWHAVELSLDYTARIFIINLICSRADSTDASLYEFTRVLLAEALEKLSLRGVLVRVVIDEKKTYSRWSLINELSGSGVAVRKDTQ